MDPLHQPQVPLALFAKPCGCLIKGVRPEMVLVLGEVGVLATPRSTFFISATFPNVKITKTSTKIGVEKACRGSSCSLPIIINYPKQEKIYLLYVPNRKVYLLHYPGKRKKDFLLAQQQAQPMQNATAQPVSSHHHPELLLSSSEFS